MPLNLPLAYGEQFCIFINTACISIFLNQTVNIQRNGKCSDLLRLLLSYVKSPTVSVFNEAVHLQLQDISQP